MKTPEIVEAMDDSERRELAAEGFFVKSSDSLFVFCPSGAVLRPKSTKKNGRVRYMKKSACYSCAAPYFERTEKKRWKEIDFSPSVIIKGDGALLEKILTGK